MSLLHMCAYVTNYWMFTTRDGAFTRRQNAHVPERAVGKRSWGSE